jgi:hypothetical protein
MEGWVNDWLAERRANGEKGLEVKKINNSYYVYRSTSHWDKAEKKVRKTSVYLGSLDQLEGFRPGEKRLEVACVRSVWQYGNAVLLDKVFQDLVPVLREEFEQDWRELLALAMVRAQGYVPLKRAESAWEALYDLRKLGPDMDPKNLGQMLRQVGLNRKGQNALFQRLAVNGEELIYDLSSFFTRSDEINLAEKGYNKDHVHLKQVNLALLCSADANLPTMIRALPGSVRDVASLYKSIEEMGVENKTLILDRGFFSEDVGDFLQARKVKYVMPARRNSKLYEEGIKLTGHLFYHDRLIKYGRRKRGSRFLYLFEDVQLRAEEERNLYRLLDERKVDAKHIEETSKAWGNILILSNLDVDGREIYALYKKRDGIEKLFDAYKTTLNADRTYLQDDASIFGHVFVSFLSLYAYCVIEQRIKRAGLQDRFSPVDVLLELSKVYRVAVGGRELDMEVPKKVLQMDKRLDTGIFPKSPS